MTSRDFCYWLQGFLEINGVENSPGTQIMSRKQVEMIQKHLSMVFVHEIDPSVGSINHQQELTEIHSGFPRTEAEAVAKWGRKPSHKHEFNLHGWYNPEEGIPKCYLTMS